MKVITDKELDDTTVQIKCGENYGTAFLINENTAITVKHCLYNDKEKKYETNAVLLVYINNEEICINEAGQGKILLFDLINNEVKTNNEAYEIVTIFKQVANGMNIKFSIKIQEQKIENLRKECLEYIERH